MDLLKAFGSHLKGYCDAIHGVGMVMIRYPDFRNTDFYDWDDSLAKKQELKYLNSSSFYAINFAG